MKLFIDIETAPQYSFVEFNDNQPPAKWKDLLTRKARAALSSTDGLIPSSIWSQASLHPEFGRVVCVCVGYAHPGGRFMMRSLCSSDERKLLSDVAGAIDRSITLVAHNGKDFDYPFLAKRMIINGIALPGLLNIRGKKPWEVSLEDTMEMWRFGSFKGNSSLDSIAMAMGFPSPKEDMNGSEVADAFYCGRYNDIAAYCANDVLTLARVYHAIVGKPMDADCQIEVKYE